MKGFKKTTIKISTAKGPHESIAFVHESGLALTPQLTHDYLPLPNVWNVTHIKTGLKIDPPNWYADQKDARRWLLKIASLADWPNVNPKRCKRLGVKVEKLREEVRAVEINEKALPKVEAEVKKYLQQQIERKL